MCRNTDPQTGPTKQTQDMAIFHFNTSHFLRDRFGGESWEHHFLPKEQDSVDRIRKALEEARRWVGEE